MIHNTPQGKLIQKRFPGEGELIGHSAIRAYFELREGQGENWECTDFTDPSNFPAIIVRAIKRGDMAGFPCPRALFVADIEGKLKAYAEWAKADAGLKKAAAERKKAYAEWAKADAEREKVYAEWKKAYAEWKKAAAEWQKADAEWQKIESRLLWALFANPENRAPAWRN